MLTHLPPSDCDCAKILPAFLETILVTMESEVEIVIDRARAPKLQIPDHKTPYDPDTVIAKQRAVEGQKIYGRGRPIKKKNIKDKKLRGNLTRLEGKYKEATLAAKDAEILLENSSGFLEPEHELERTYKARQDEVKENVSVETAKNGFELRLQNPLQSYVCDYTRNGRGLLLAGRKGHVATMDWRGGIAGCELQLGETVRDAKWLHNDQYFAVAQKKYTYIYDHAGVELHWSVLP